MTADDIHALAIVRGLKARIKELEARVDSLTEQGAAGARGSFAASSAIWAIACLLTKHTPAGITFTQTLSWRRCVTEDEARGEAVAFALKERPGYAIEMVTITEIPSSPNNSGQTAATNAAK